MFAGGEMHELLQEEVFGTNTREYWLEKLIANGGIPTAPVLSYVDVVTPKAIVYSSEFCIRIRILYRIFSQNTTCDQNVELACDFLDFLSSLSLLGEIRSRSVNSGKMITL